MGMVHSFLHPEEAYQAAQVPVTQSWNQAQQYESPYMQHGQDQYSALNQGRQALMDPAQLQSEWAKHYQTSPYAQQMLAQSKSQGMDAASSMGLMGSSGALHNIQANAGNIMQKDRQQYMQDLMQKYLAGLGLGQNLYNTGANMASHMGDQSMQYGQNMAGLKYGENAAPGQMFGNLVGGAATLAGNALALPTGGGSTVAGSIINHLVGSK